MKKSPLILIISLLLASMVVLSPVYANPTTLSVGPPSIIDTTKVAGTTFTININIKDVTDLYTFDFFLNYSTAVLAATEVTLGSFFPLDSMEWKNEIDDTLGYVRYLVSLPLGTPKGEGINGSGTLATINFAVDSLGETILDLCNTKLSDSYADYIAHDLYDGYFSNVPRPKVFVDPESIVNPDLVPGENFTINVKVFNATDLFGFDFLLNYSTAVLTATEVTLGPFFPSDSVILHKEINDTVGYVRYNATLPVGTPYGKIGNGTLAIINFTVDSVAETLLDLYDTKLVDSKGEWIDHDTVDGYFNNKPIVHDVAITEVATVVTKVEVRDNVTFNVAEPVNEVHTGENVSVTVSVKNNGTMTETFTVTAYYGNTTISTKNVTDLLDGASITLTFEWSTEGVATGDYTIWAEASTVIGETNTANNKFTKEGEFAVLPRQSFPIELAVAAIVLIIAAAAVAVYFIKIRKPKPA